MQADTERILNGEEPLPPSSSVNYEGDLPKNFTKWLEKNETRIANAKSLPYFLKDNQDLINNQYTAVASPFTDDAYTTERKNNAVWDTGDGSMADKALWGTASKSWLAADDERKFWANNYTGSYYPYNEPLRGRQYKKPQTKDEFVKKVTELTEYIDSSPLPCDMWFQRGDDFISALRSRIEAAGGVMPSDIYKIVGMTLREDGFMSTGSGYKSGFAQKDYVFKIYAPKGTKAAYVEPFSQYGYGAKHNLIGNKGLDWDGKQHITQFENEQETTFQRGTIMRVTKVEQKGGKTYIECEVIGQDVRDLSYVKDSNIGK